MDAATSHSVLQLLGNAMSDVSEEAYCGGWLGGTEHIVPELCRRAVATGFPQHWGHTEISPDRALGLLYLADQLGCWANRDAAGTGYVPFDPFPVPQDIAAFVDSEQLTRSGIP